jgi:predicted  nucleic acid-binding Zn-ribbon protein
MSDEIKELQKKVIELRSEIAVLKDSITKCRSDLDAFRNQEAKINNLNERVRFAMEHIADELEISLFSLFDPVGKR